jgi:golgi to ER traffic protein 4
MSSNDRLVSKLSQLLKNGDYYEAHQIYRTLYHRMMRSNKTLQLSDMLYEGSIHLLVNGEHNSGADVACLYLDVITHMNGQQLESHLQNNQNTQLLTNIRKLFELIPCKTPERVVFISKAIKLNYSPISSIHKQFAIVLWHEKNYSESRNHFVHSCSDSGEECALMLIEYQTSLGFPSEVDLFITQFVLQVLCVKNKSLADNTFHAYTSKHPNISKTNPPFSLPLLNFIWFLLVAIDRYLSIISILYSILL